MLASDTDIDHSLIFSEWCGSNPDKWTKDARSFAQFIQNESRSSDIPASKICDIPKLCSTSKQYVPCDTNTDIPQNNIWCEKIQSIPHKAFHAINTIWDQFKKLGAKLFDCITSVSVNRSV